MTLQRTLGPSTGRAQDRGWAARPPWGREVVLVAASYGLYTLTRNTLPAHESRARANALDLARAERHLHLDIERTLNDAVAGHSTNPLSVLANYTYSLSHLLVTLAVLVWLYVARPQAYRTARTVLLVTTILGLIGFWLYPLAPPRFFPELGFIDTSVRDGTWGSWGSSTVAALSNQYAAMPSIHVAWSTWSAAAVAVCVRRRWLKAVALLYPLLVFVVILGTANHWTLDAAGGVAVIGLGAAVPVVASRRPDTGRTSASGPRRRRRDGGALRAPGRPGRHPAPPAVRDLSDQRGPSHLA
jgi:hypothetical protein